MFRTILTGFLLSALLAFNSVAWAQDKIIDHIVAVVGNNIILKSDIEERYKQHIAEGTATEGDMKCMILENFLVEKLLLAEAQLDTNIQVTDFEVNQQMDRQIQFYVKNLGSERAVESYFNKTIPEIKAKLEEDIRNGLMTSRMQGKILQKVNVTPAEVRYYYRNADQTQVPMVRAQVEYAQISFYPRMTVEEENELKARLREFKRRVEEEGESFTTLAVLYSEDAAAPNGGELGYMGRGELDAAYAAAAFGLRGDRVSNVVRSDAGYHIIQLVGRRGEQINTRHIILRPKPSAQAMTEAAAALDSLANAIRKGSISFEQAALRYSEDKTSRGGGGVAINPLTLSSKWQWDELEPADSKVLDKLRLNEISDPFRTEDEKEQVVYKIVKMVSNRPEHRANLQEDYQFLSEDYLNRKREETMKKWIAERQAKTYIRIDDTYLNCDFIYGNWIK